MSMALTSLESFTRQIHTSIDVACIYFASFPFPLCPYSFFIKINMVGNNYHSKHAPGTSESMPPTVRTVEVTG